MYTPAEMEKLERMRSLPTGPERVALWTEVEHSAATRQRQLRDNAVVPALQLQVRELEAKLRKFEER